MIGDAKAGSCDRALFPGCVGTLSTGVVGFVVVVTGQPVIQPRWPQLLIPLYRPVQAIWFG